MGSGVIESIRDIDLTHEADQGAQGAKLLANARLHIETY
jgi:hypothetical protein